MDGIATETLSPLERRLIERYQRGQPLCPRPWAAIAEEVGSDEAQVLEALARLQRAGVIGRIGAVVAPHRVGSSTLAAMRVPPARLCEVAALVGDHPEVNHNYAREHEVNLWFVVAAASRERVAHVLDDIARRTDLEVIELPLERAYAIDLGFVPEWD